QDDRHDAVQLLSTKIDLFRTSNVFEEWKMKIQSLKDCYHLTAEKLEHRPECPHCHFNPREELNREKVSLDELDEDLESILSKWTDTLLTNFNDPVVKESIELLEGKQKQLIQSFIKSQEFTMPISIELINAINIVLKGIHQEKIAVEQLIKVVGDGNPITVQEAKQNFEKLLRALVGNNDESRVRLTVKK
ncbi:MAG: ATP-binding protein, partial [Bacteroidales bacterium]|nr:ATP-binding protein [Bacteroidales bacterium]